MSTPPRFRDDDEPADRPTRWDDAYDRGYDPTPDPIRLAQADIDALHVLDPDDPWSVALHEAKQRAEDAARKDT